MGTTSQTPLVSALNFILKGSSRAVNPDFHILDYGDPTVFAALWGDGMEKNTLHLVNPAIDLNAAGKAILIVGNEPPESIFNPLSTSLRGINLASHFSAAAWLAAWKVKFSPTQQEKDEMSAVEAHARIAVIDPRPTNMAQGADRTLQTILGARDIIGQSLVPGAVVLNAPSLSEISSWLHLSKLDTRTVAKDAPYLRDLLKSTIWNELTSNREQHHALSNVLGPVILSGKKINEKCLDLNQPSEGNDDEEKQHVAALDRINLLLRRLLSACGLVSWDDTEQEEVAEKSPSTDTGQNLSVMLLDDQANQGWEDWVKECLPGAAGMMKVAVSPTSLVDTISQALHPITDTYGAITGYKNKDARFQLKLPGLSSATLPVLLLDLRLFSGDEVAGRAFFRTKLLPLVNHFKITSDLAWPGFSGDFPHFESAKAAVDTDTLKPDTDEYHEVLTWLPRVVALADMSLPIILFSSTGRRDLLEAFKPYGNIFTSFEKPTLNNLASKGDHGSVSDIRVATKFSLKEAVAQARSWLVFREAVGMALRSHRATPLTSPKIVDSDKKHFEIYFDESGSSREDGFRVAALVVGYKDEPHAAEVAKKMHDAGVSWFHDDKDNGTFIFDKGASRDPQNVSQMALYFSPWFVDLWMHAVVLWAAPETGSVASDAFNADTLIQSLIEKLIEISLFVLLPNHERPTFAIYGAQRRIEIDGTKFYVNWDNGYQNKQGKDLSFADLKSILGQEDIPADALGNVDKVQESKGVACSDMVWRIDKDTTSGRQPKAIIKSMLLSIKSGQEYAGIVARAFQTRPWSEPWSSQAKRVAVRFAPLNHDEKATLEKKHRPVHIVADMLPGDAAWGATPALGVSAEMLPKNGSPDPIFITEGMELSLLLGICRALDSGDFALALAGAAKLTNTCEPHAAYFYQAVRSKIAYRLDQLRGSDLIGAVHHCAVLPNGADGPLPTSNIDIRHQHWTRYPQHDSAALKTLAEYCKRHLVVDFGVSYKSMEKNVAEYFLRKILIENNVNNFSTIEWWRDKGWRFDGKGKKNAVLFAVVELSTRQSDLFKRASFVIPPSLRADCEGIKLTIAASIGAIPTGRLIIGDGGSVQWFECEAVTLCDRKWTDSQIEPVLNHDQPKKLRPLPLQDASKATANIRSSPQWYDAGNGSVVLFLYDADFKAASQTLKCDLPLSHLSPDDFDQSGQLLHGQSAWPKVRLQSNVAAEQRTNTRWMIKQYENEAQYWGAGENWHKNGFKVLAAVSRNNPRITVFADIEVVGTNQIPHDFKPAHSSQLDCEGNPMGTPLPGTAWTPRQ